jgi:dUTP pyrophosphatase
MNKEITVQDNELLFAKVKKNATIPSKIDENGWYDIYACLDEESVIIQPHAVKLIPSGIATAFSSKWRLSIGERGSNTKSTLIVMAGKVDSGFRGEIFIALYNGNNYPVEITKAVDKVEFKKPLLFGLLRKGYIKVPYSKAVAQFSIEEVPQLEEKEIIYDELKSIDSIRGTGMLGSSNK